jgi:hypothetical protein
MEPQPPDASLSEELLEVADAQLAVGRYEIAVVIAQVAVETVAGAAFASLLALNVPRSLETMLSVLPDRSFQHEGTRRLWQELTCDRISKCDHWKAYDGPHIKRRNRAAHGATLGLPGAHENPITREGAQESVAACRGMVAHMHRILAGQFDRLLRGGPDGGRAPELDRWRALAVLSPRPVRPERRSP